MDRSAPFHCTGTGAATAGSLPVITELEFKARPARLQPHSAHGRGLCGPGNPLAHLKLAHTKDGGKHSFLLESVVGGERFRRYSFIGLPARTLLRASGFCSRPTTEVVTDGQVVETAQGNLLDFIEAYQKRFKGSAPRPAALLRWPGRLLWLRRGALHREKARNHGPPDTLGCPDILLLQCEELAVIDNLSGKLCLIVYADPAQPEAYAKAKRLRELKEQLGIR